MSDGIEKRLAIQSWCFRRMKTNADVISALRSCGASAVELSNVHVNPLAADYAQAIKEYANAGIAIASFGVQRFDADAQKGRKTFEFARAAGIKVINSTFGPGGLEMTEKLCKEFGIKVMLHNHGRHDVYGSVYAIEDLFKRSSENVGLCLDTAWMLDSGDDPLEVAKRFRQRLYGLHIKDFVFDRAGRPHDCIVGTGNLNLNGLAAFLKETRYDGMLTLEYEGDENNPVPATKQCVQAVKAAFSK
jgi:sugar phosphate isomerase/epimerase